MNLEQIAQQAMDYLDRVGVAAEWEIRHGDTLRVFAGECIFQLVNIKPYFNPVSFMETIKEIYPTKSPN